MNIDELRRISLLPDIAQTAIAKNWVQALVDVLEELDQKLGEYQVLLSDAEHRVSVNEARLAGLDRRTRSLEAFRKALDGTNG